MLQVPCPEGCPARSSHLCPRGLPGTQLRAKQGERCPFPGFRWDPLSQADPGAPAPWAGTLTPAHPRGWHVSCLAQRPPSEPIIGRTTRRVLLTPQPGQAQEGAGPFHLPGPQLPLSLAWTEMFLNSISQGPRGPWAGGAGRPLRPLTKEPHRSWRREERGPACV